MIIQAGVCIYANIIDKYGSIFRARTPDWTKKNDSKDRHSGKSEESQGINNHPRRNGQDRKESTTQPSHTAKGQMSIIYLST